MTFHQAGKSHHAGMHDPSKLLESVFVQVSTIAASLSEQRAASDSYISIYASNTPLVITFNQVGQKPTQN
jgi:hypothetical protein